MKEVISFAGIIELMRPLNQMSVGYRERLAEELHLVADRIRKGEEPAATNRFVLEIVAEDKT